MLKRRIEKMEIVPNMQYPQSTEQLYSLYINGELTLHASAKYMADVVKEYLLNSQNEEDKSMTKKHYPCDDEPFICPFDAQGGDACRYYCGLGVDENEPEDYYDYEEDEE